MDYNNLVTSSNDKLAKFQKQKTRKAYHDKQTKLLAIQKNNVSVMASYLVKNITPKAWRAFHGILAMAQYITVGFTLLGALARISDEASKLFEVNSEGFKEAIPADKPNEEVGEEMSVTAVTQAYVTQKTGTSIITGKIKKRSTSNYFDSLFGESPKKKKKKRAKQVS